jgi:hypothetical protein
MDFREYSSHAERDESIAPPAIAAGPSLLIRPEMQVSSSA